MRGILWLVLAGCATNDAARAPEAGLSSASIVVILPTDTGRTEILPTDTGAAPFAPSDLRLTDGVSDSAGFDSGFWTLDSGLWEDSSVTWTTDSAVASSLSDSRGDSGLMPIGGGGGGASGGLGDSAPVLGGGSGDADSDGDPDASDCAPDDPSIHALAGEIPADGIDQDCDGRDACRRDRDGDGYASEATIDAPDFDCVDPGEAPAGAPDDCDDGDPAVTDECARVQCYRDLDGDGAGTIIIFDDGDGVCTPADGEAPVGDDCDDADAGVSPALEELAGNVVDEDCDGLVACYLDGDGDGFGAAVGDDLDDDCDDPTEVTVGGDCDDAAAEVYPGHAELVANGADDDCDGFDACFADGDGDGYGSADVIADDGAGAAPLCLPGAGESPISGDCNDADAAISPGLPDIAANGVDENCDGSDGCFYDGDRDGYGTRPVADQGAPGCLAGEYEAPVAGDCDDFARDVNPGVEELPANAKDDDCDGVHLCYVDGDGDDFGSELTVDDDGNGRCLDRGESNNKQDCNDADRAINPNASDNAGDGVDADCDGKERCPVDKDEDGYTSGLGYTTTLDCSADGFAPAGSPTGDCADEDAARHPGAVETPADGVDSDCDGQELCFLDADGDGYAAVAGALAPSDALDCVGEGVGGPGLPEGDCDDDARRVNPGMTEVGGDGVDSNCDGQELCFVDADGDGYTVEGGLTALSSTADCSETGFRLSVSRVPDCDDESAEVNPAGEDIPGDGVDQDCSGTDRLDVNQKAGCGCDNGAPASGLAVVLAAAVGWARRRRR